MILKIQIKKYLCQKFSSGFTYKKGLISHCRYDRSQVTRFKCPYPNIYKKIIQKHVGFRCLLCQSLDINCFYL